jgi:hypothetical protein
MRRIAALAALVLAVGACGGGGGSGERSDSPPTATTSATPNGPSPTSPSPAPSSPSATPIELPPHTASTVDADVDAAGLDPADLIPRGADVEQTWITHDPEALVVAYAVPGADPFRSDRGTIVWRRVDEPPAWRAVAWFPTSAASGVLGVDGIVADVSGDGHQDVLMAAYTGGSGACARWTVVDVEAADQVFARDLCDGRIDPSPDPVGLSIDQAVYRVGDPHCCPSAFRTTVLTYDGDGTWTVASKDVRDSP